MLGCVMRQAVDGLAAILMCAGRDRSGALRSGCLILIAAVAGAVIEQSRVGAAAAGARRITIVCSR